MANLQTGFTTFLALPLSVGATTATLGTVPTATQGRLHLYDGSQEEWVSYTGVSGVTVTGLTRNLSQTADPATGGTGLTWIAGTPVDFVAMHDQIVDKTGSNTYATGTIQTFPDIDFTGTTTGGIRVKNLTTAQRDAIASPLAGQIIYNTTTLVMNQYIAGAWTDFSTGTTAAASTTVAGKVELGTALEMLVGTATGGTGAAIVPGGDVFLAATELQHGLDTVSNYIIGTSRSGNAETISLLTKAGTAPSATDPVHIAFRNVTAGTGDYTIATISAALTVVINNTATMGATNSVPFRLWLVAFNTAGVVSLGIVNTQLSGGGIYQLNEDILGSSTTIGTGSDSAGVIYSTAGVTAKAYKILGYLDYTLAAVGVWGTAPTKIQMYSKGVRLPGQLVQKIESVVTTSSTGTTVLPYDNTIPQNTEGDQYLTASITPTAGANKLWIESSCSISNDSATTFASALFQDSTAGALAARGGGASAGVVSDLRIDHTMVASTTSSTTFNIRAGGSGAGTTTFNGTVGTRVLGGVLNSYIKISEIMV